MVTNKRNGVGMGDLDLKGYKGIKGFVNRNIRLLEKTDKNDSKNKNRSRDCSRKENRDAKRAHFQMFSAFGQASELLHDMQDEDLIGKASDTMDEIRKAAAKFGDMPEKLASVLSSLEETFAHIKPYVAGVSSFDKIVNSSDVPIGVRDFLEKLFKDPIGLLKALISSVPTLLLNNPITSIGALVALVAWGFATLLYSSSVWLSDLMSWIYKKLSFLWKVNVKDENGVKTAELQMFTESSVDSIGQVLSALLFFVTTKSDSCRDWTQIKWSKLVDSFRNYKPAAEGISSFLKNIYDFFIYIVNNFLGMLGYDLQLDFVKTGIERFDKIVADVTDMHSRYVIGRLPFTEVSYAKLTELNKELDDFLAYNKVGVMKTTIGARLLPLRSALHKLSEAFRSSDFMIAGYRVEPVALLLTGRPGVGKSTLVEYLHNALGSALVGEELREQFEEDPTKFMYNRCQENVYWEGYSLKSTTVVFDDFGQQPDSRQNLDSEPMNIIRSANSFPYQLHMAELSQKANSYFRSPLIIATSNLERFDFESIREAAAVGRRFDLAADVFVAPQYAKESMCGDMVIDPEKLPKDSEGRTHVPIDAFIFRLYDPVLVMTKGEKRYKGEMFFGQFVSKVRNLLLDKKERFKAQRQYAKTLIAESCLDKQDAYDERLVDPDEVVGNVDGSTVSAETLRAMCKEHLAADMEDLVSVDDLPAVDLEVKERFDKLPIAVRKAFHWTFSGDVPFTNGEAGGFRLRLRAWRLLLRKKSGGYAVFLPLVDDDAGFIRQLLGSLYDCVKISFMTKVYMYACAFQEFKKQFDESTHPYLLFFPNLSTVANEFVLAAARLPSRWLDLTNNPMAMVFDFVVSYCATSAISWLVKKLCKWVFPAERIVDSEVQSVGATGKSHAFKTYGRTSKTTGVPKKALQMGDEGKLSACESFTRGILRANMRKITVVRKGKGVDDVKHVASLGYLIGIVGKYYIGCAHFPAKLMETFEGRDLSLYHLRLSRHSNGGHTLGDDFIPFEEFITSNYYPDCWEQQKSDLLVYYLPSVGNIVRDIRDKFADDRAIKAYGLVEHSAYFPVYDQLAGCMELPIVPVHIPSSYAIRVDDIVLRKIGVSKVSTRVGDCGRVLVPLDQVGGKHVILGMHFAGDGGGTEGYFSILRREEVALAINDAIKSFEEVPIVEKFAEAQIGHVETFYERFEVMERLAKIPPTVAWSKLKRTKVVLPHSVYKGSKAPALLRKKIRESDGVAIDPWKNALDKYCTEPVPLPHSMLKDAAGALEARYVSLKRYGEFRLYTFEEACGGLVDDPWFSSLDRNTSPGFPWIQEGISRKDIFGTCEEFDYSSKAAQLLRADVEDTIEAAKHGIRRKHIFKDCLKDELRPYDKVIEGKTRMFSGCPLTLLVVYRMYFGSFSRWFNVVNVDIGSGVGIDPLGPKWSAIAERLCAAAHGSTGICAGDYSRYDGSEKPFIHDLILGVIETMYKGSPEDRLIRRVLWLELTNSRHAMGDVVYEWLSSLPSGHPLTAIVNTMYNHIAFITVWAILAQRERVEHDAFSFYENVSFFALGDDNVWSCNPEVRSWFNHETVSVAMKELALTYTDELKGEANTNLFRDINEVTFLKRGFVHTPKESPYWRAPLEFPSILERLLWWRKSPVGETALVLTNAQAALYELAVHGKDTFERFAPFIIDGVNVYGNLEFTTYYACKRRAGWIFKLPFVDEQASDWLPTEYDYDDAAYHPDGFHDATSLDIYPYAQCGSEAVPPNTVQSITPLQTMTRSVEYQMGVTEFNDKTHVQMRTNARDTGFGNIGTNFNDAEVTESRVGLVRPVPRSLIDQSAANNKNTIQDFLGRPFAYYQGNLASTDSATTFPRTWNLVSVLSNTYYLQKMQGFAGIRATLVVRLQVNANRFQQGRYILAWLPTVGADSDPISLNDRSRMQAFSKTQITQLPHVELDINCDTEAILRIPYVSNTLYFPFSSCYGGARDFGDVGNFFVYPYSPLVSAAGSTTAGYTVWTHFEDIELLGSATYQMGKVQDQEVKESENHGIVSGPAMKVAKAATILADIPLLSSFMTPTAWMANAFSNAAAAFGFSAPSKFGAVEGMTPFPVAHMNASDVPRNAMTVGNAQHNQVISVSGLGGTDFDEMSFSYLFQIPAYLYTYTWTTSNAVGTVVGITNNGTGAWFNSVSDGTATLINRPPFSFIAAMFSQWRGSVEFTFKFIKTEFHSGRLEFAYYPYVADSLNTPATSQQLSTYVYREIVDIRYCNEFKFRCPYISPTPWIHTGTGGTAGSIYIRVVDPLVAPATVSSTVTILVEANGGPDFEVAGLPNAFLQPVTPATYQMGMVENEDSPSPCEVEQYEIGTLTNDLYYSAVSVGERINSFRQLGKKYYPILWNNAVVGTTDFTPPAGYFSAIYPTASTIVTSGAIGLTGNSFSDLFSILSSAYGYYRGGVRLRLSSVSSQGEGGTLRYVVGVWATPNGQPSGVNAPVFYQTTNTNVHSIPPINSMISNISIFNDEATGGVDIHVPAYTPKLVRATGLETWVWANSAGSGVWATPALNANQVSPLAITVTAGNVQFQSVWFRSMADDGEFGRFISFPPTST
jgi:hypothetical protein